MMLLAALSLSLKPIRDPVAVFLVILAIMLVAPLIFEKFKLPGIVGLILAGVIVGPEGLGLLERGSNIILLSTIGLLFLMFMAGLETSLDDLKDNGDKAVVFGLATFIAPMVVGTSAMMLLGYGWLAAVLVASCFASHTLLALPVLGKLGIMRSSAVNVTLGGTLITNVLALLVLAVVVKAFEGELTLGFWLFLIPALTIYTFTTLWGVPKIGRWFFHKFGHDESAEFIFVLATLFVVSYIAGLIEVEPIIGAFLAGIALTPLIPQLSPLMNRIQFIGNTLFVPFFLISVGMLIDPLVLIREPKSLVVAVVMIVAELISKFIAAWVTGKWFGFKFPSTMVMFGLSIAQAASTLAAITVAYEIELVDRTTVNGIVAMILFTCIASPLVTERWGRQVTTAEKNPQSDNQNKVLAQRVLVPVANPNNEDNLLNLAIILAKTADGTVLPLNVLSDREGKVSSEGRIQQRQLLDTAETLAHAANATVETIGRVDDGIDRGIVRTAIERDASLVVCGWKGYSTYQDSFFGSMIDNVALQLPIPVLIARFVKPIANTARVFLAVTKRQALSEEFPQTLSIAKMLSNELKTSLEVLLVVTNKQTQLSASELTKLSADIVIGQLQGNFIKEVSQKIYKNDLLLLPVKTLEARLRNRSAVGTIPEAIARSHDNVSVVVIHFPLSG
ncbi:cation:proton antiporter domain-containing protein [Waterburya agarophytonicola]|uniref:cation:proton antiporter domain-containing protein n=1 Tax=Waterburya agarophytonicola TaxID=2886916 RepID=UPI001E538285|nr:cation:proton antiporter [Waterburya agarophytonicola]